MIWPPLERENLAVVHELYYISSMTFKYLTVNRLQPNVMRELHSDNHESSCLSTMALCFPLHDTLTMLDVLNVFSYYLIFEHAFLSVDHVFFFG